MDLKESTLIVRNWFSFKIWIKRKEAFNMLYIKKTLEITKIS